MRDQTAGWPFVALGVLLFVGTYLGLAVLASPAVDQGRQIISEQGMVTALSSSLLAAAGAFFLVAAIAENRDRHRLFFAVVAVGFFYFSIDEIVQIHEKAGSAFGRVVGGSGAFRNFNDVIVIGYGIIAIAVLAAFFREASRHPEFVRWVSVGFGFFVLHTAIDSLAFQPTTRSRVLEESAKLFASAFFAVAGYRVAAAIIRRLRRPA